MNSVPVDRLEPSTVAGAEGSLSFGVYVHVPFCAKRCDYCAFATWTDRSHLMDQYADAVVREVRGAVEREALPVATSVFFGGGTPSMLPGAALMAILDAIPRTADAEVTVECNPDTVSAELFEQYRAHGVNRVSFGVQSMVDAVLRSLGRTHDRANVVRGVEMARAAGFASFNLDLIYGAVGESLDDWRATVDAVLALDPPHVSAYALTVEADTPLAADPARHPDDDDQADKYLLADEAFGAAGLASYEISNWARPGHECRHNWLYWAQESYRGFGCAAHSFTDGERWWNVRTPERYLGHIAGAGSSPVQPARSAGERLDAAASLEERLQLSLRTRAGVPATALDLRDLDGLVVPADEPGRVRLTASGRLLANEISTRLR